MILTFWKRANPYNKAHRVFVVAEGIQAVEEDGDGSILHMVGGPDIEVSHKYNDVVELLGKLMQNWFMPRDGTLPEPYYHGDD